MVPAGREDWDMVGGGGGGGAGAVVGVVVVGRGASGGFGMGSGLADGPVLHCNCVKGGMYVNNESWITRCHYLSSLLLIIIHALPSMHHPLLQPQCTPVTTPAGQCHTRTH